MKRQVTIEEVRPYPHTLNKELDDILLRLQQIQRKAFREGSPIGIGISPFTSFGSLGISVAAENTTRELRRADGHLCHSKGFYFAADYPDGRNEETLRELEEFLVIKEQTNNDQNNETK